MDQNPKRKKYTSFPTVELPPEVIEVLFPLTEEQKKWPVVPLSKMMKAEPLPVSKPSEQKPEMN